MHRQQERALSLILWVSTVCICFAAHAQSPDEFGTVFQPYADSVAGDHAEATVANPGGLVFGDPLQLSFTFGTAERDQTTHGYSLMASTRLGRGFAAGFGYERLQLPGRQSSLPQRLSWATSVRLGSNVGVGLSGHHLQGRQLGAYDGKMQLKMGLQIRPYRWLATGAVAEYLNEPQLGDEQIGRRWLFGASVRPGTEAIELSGYARLLESTSKWGYGVRGVWNVWGPLGLLTRFDSVPGPNDRIDQATFGLNWDAGLQTGIAVGNNATDWSPRSSSRYLTIRTSRPGEVRPLTNKRVLFAHLIVDNAREYQVSGLFWPRASTPFLNILRTMDDLANNESVDGVLIDLRTRSMGWAQAGELSDAIARLKARGKKVIAWIPATDTRTYAAVSSCDTLFSTPSGGHLLTGVRASTDHLKGGLDKLGVKAEFVTTGAYKTFPEAFTNDRPSKASQEVQNVLVDQIYETIVAAIATGRKLSPARVKALIDEGPYTNDRALKAGLIDQVLHYDEFEHTFRKTYGRRALLMPAGAFRPARPRSWGRRDAIAVVYITGTITDGASNQAPFVGQASTGSETIIQSLEALRVDSRVKRVVVRIDSPGGSVSASDAIWRAIRRVDKVKPVYISMGNVSASGGYYAAVGARAIYASELTITGSIGVFAGKFSGQELMTKLGVYRAEYIRGKNANILGADRPWSDSERAAIQRNMDAYYALFLKRVKAGRPNLTHEQIKTNAAGRVWTGGQAKQRGLIDAHQGLLETIKRAAKDIGGLSEIDVIAEPSPKTAFSIGRLPFAFGWSQDRTSLPPILESYLENINAALLLFESGQALAILPYAVE